MPVRLAKGFAVALAALGVAAMPHPAFARDDYGFRDIMVEEGGKKPPVKKQQKGPDTSKDAAPKQRPRGSGYVPSANLPRTEPVVVAPASPGVYKPPPINSFGDRVTNCIHSFPLARGLGNNPNEQQAFIRQCAN
jgi:hypothetical protein